VLYTNFFIVVRLKGLLFLFICFRWLALSLVH